MTKTKLDAILILLGFIGLVLFFVLKKKDNDVNKQNNRNYIDSLNAIKKENHFIKW